MCRHPDWSSRRVWLALAVTLVVAAGGCAAPGPPLPPEETVETPHEGKVIVYVEAPRRRAGPILTSFTKQTGIEVEAVYAENIGESFLGELKSEAIAGRVDLLWATSTLWPIDLQRAGLTTVFRPVQARPVPGQYLDREFHWIGFAVNPRVIIFNTTLVERARAPRSILDLTRAPWGGRGAMARIPDGTPAFHAAALFSLWGTERGREFFEEIRSNKNVIAEDDAAVLSLVASGAALWGIVDLDAAICAKRYAEPIHIFFPDRLSLGAVVAPEVAVLVRGAPNPAQARGLFAFLFSTETAWQLGQDDCALLTLMPNIPRPEWVPVLGGVNVTQVDNQMVYDAYRDNYDFFSTWGAESAAPVDPREPQVVSAAPRHR